MTELTVQDLTTGNVSGDGIFDLLMAAVKAHLDEEYSKNRLTGDAFAKVYLGSITAVLQQAAQFALQKDQASLQAQLIEKQVEKMSEEILLTSQQRANMIVENANLALQGEKLGAEKALVDAQVSAMSSDVALKQQQLLNMQAEALLIPKQGEKLDADVDMTTAQTLKVAADTALTDQRKLNLVVEKDNLAKQGDQLVAQTALSTTQKAKLEQDILVSGKQLDKLTAEILNIPKQGTLLDQQQLKAAADTALVVQNKAIADVEEDLRIKQLDKSDQEIAILTQRVKTEKAQISDTVDGVTVAGVIGKQKALQAAQTEGFAQDSRYKIAKLATDVWAVQRTTDEGISPAGAGLADAELSKMINAAKTGVGITS